MAAPISLRAYAAKKGVSVEAVSQAIKAGRLVKSVKYVAGKPKIADAALADQEWAANTDQSKPRNAITGDPKHRRAAGDPMKPMDNEAPGEAAKGPSYARSRAVREAFQAQLARLEYEEKAGKLVSADVVRIAAFNATREARDAFLNIPDRVSGLLVGMDERSIHTMLMTELRRVCGDLSNRAANAATAATED